MVNGSNIPWATKKIPEIRVSNDGRTICLPGACNAQHFSFVSQECDIPDYFQIILQIPLNTMGNALNVGCNWGGISAVKHYPHVTWVWLPVSAQVARPQLAGAMVGLPELCDETNAMLFLLLTWHMFNHRIVLSWKGTTRIIESNS